MSVHLGGDEAEVEAAEAKEQAADGRDGQEL
jgi:hypothetical protein